MKNIILLYLILFSFVSQFISAQTLSKPTPIKIGAPAIVSYTVAGGLTQHIDLKVSTKAQYANLTLVSGDQILIDHLDVPTTGTFSYSFIATFNSEGAKNLEFRATSGNVILESLNITDLKEPIMPVFKDISEKAGLDRVNSIKYGGPTIADVNNDGYYDFIVNNHNEETNKLYWNNGDGTVTKDQKKLSKWYHHDLHGSSAADFDNDGDLDIMLSQGGGNGTTPSLPTFYRNDNGTFIPAINDLGITKGARGRAVRWIDMDKDGDLDLILINAKSITKDNKPQHLFYRNKGDGTFEDVGVNEIENFNGERIVVTDLNGDQIEDLVLYAAHSGISLWKGNGDFTFTNITDQLGQKISSTKNITGITDIDIDNDGDLDLYLARGLVFGAGPKPSLDFDPITHKMDIKLHGEKGVTELDFIAKNELILSNLRLGRRKFKKPYPIFLGKQKKQHIVKDKTGTLNISKKDAKGWPKDMSANGIYIGNISGNKWKIALVREAYIFWNFGFGLEGLLSVSPKFEIGNRNVDDLLLMNENGSFKDVSEDWKIQKGGNNQGVTTSDFNNDGFQDLFVYRWGNLNARLSDYMLLNNGKNEFIASTDHGAHDPNDEGHGDMGQAFDFDLDGDIDLLNGSDDEGMWYLYENNMATTNNYALVRVNYSPKSNIDPQGATVKLETNTKTYLKRVGSVGEVFSQSLLNTVHFGLGKEEQIKHIKIIWRNGETVSFKDEKANQLFSTDNIDPVSIQVNPAKEDIRVGTQIQLSVTAPQKNMNTDVSWTSSDTSVASVDANGIVTAHKPLKDVVIIAKSNVNEAVAKANLKTVNFYPIAAKSIDFDSIPNMLVVGEKFEIKSQIEPKYADNKTSLVNSSDPSIVKVTDRTLEAISAGTTTISVIAEENEEVNDAFKLHVVPHVKPHIDFVNEKMYKSISKGEPLKITVNYDTGARLKVIRGDHGGIKFWFREFTADWKFVKHITTVVSEPLNTSKGTVTGVLPLKDRKLSSELNKGNFYLINVSLIASDGKTYSKAISPVELK